MATLTDEKATQKLRMQFTTQCNKCKSFNTCVHIVGWLFTENISIHCKDCDNDVVIFSYDQE